MTKDTDTTSLESRTVTPTRRLCRCMSTLILGLSSRFTSNTHLLCVLSSLLSHTPLESHSCSQLLLAACSTSTSLKSSFSLMLSESLLTLTVLSMKAALTSWNGLLCFSWRMDTGCSRTSKSSQTIFSQRPRSLIRPTQTTTSGSLTQSLAPNLSSLALSCTWLSFWLRDFGSLSWTDLSDWESKKTMKNLIPTSLLCRARASSGGSWKRRCAESSSTSLWCLTRLSNSSKSSRREKSIWTSANSFKALSTTTCWTTLGTRKHSSTYLTAWRTGKSWCLMEAPTVCRATW